MAADHNHLVAAIMEVQNSPPPFFLGGFVFVAAMLHRQRQRQTEERKRERRACVHKEKGVRPPVVCAASYNSLGDQLTLSNCLHLPFKLQNISVMTILFVKFLHNFFSFQVKQIYCCSHKGDSDIVKTPGPCIPYPKTLITLDGFQQEGWERRKRRFGAFCDSETQEKKSRDLCADSAKLGQ
jgi:hypothetical protein